MTTSVDVLAVMEQAACALRIDARHEQGEDMEIARAALAELIEAASEICYEVSDRSEGKRLLVDALARVKGA
jgi:hypothetical protein